LAVDIALGLKSYEQGRGAFAARRTSLEPIVDRRPGIFAQRRRRQHRAPGLALLAAKPIASLVELATQLRRAPGGLFPFQLIVQSSDHTTQVRSRVGVAIRSLPKNLPARCHDLPSAFRGMGLRSTFCGIGPSRHQPGGRQSRAGGKTMPGPRRLSPKISCDASTQTAGPSVCGDCECSGRLRDKDRH
jgi:hypothetical protein